MSWRLTSTVRPESWLSFDNSLDGDETTLEELDKLLQDRATVMLTVTGPRRVVTEMSDEVGCYLLGREEIFTDGSVLTGTPPVEDTGLAELPEGDVA